MKKEKIKAIVFDLNGVLTKGDRPNWKQVRFTAKILGVKPKKSHSLAWRKIYVPLSGGRITLEHYHEGLEGIFGKKLPPDFEEKFSCMEKAMERGIPELLKRLKAKGYKIGVLTNYYHGWAYGALKRIGALSCIDTIAVSSEIRARKPSKKAYLEAAKRLKCKPSECIYVGDELEDMEGAKKAGMGTLFIPSEDKEAPGHARISRLSDLLGML